MPAYRSQPTVTRPANTTAYTAGDVVGGVIEFDGMGPYGSAADVLITSASLRVNVAAVPSGMTSFRRHLYNKTPPSALADNAAWNLPAGDRDCYIGYIDVGSPAAVGATPATLYVQVDGINKPVRVPNGKLWGYDVTNGGFTPAGNSEVYVPELNGVEL